MSLLPLLDAIADEACQNHLTPEELIQSFSFLLIPRFNGLLQASLELIDSYGTEHFSLQLITTQPIITASTLPSRFFWRIPPENQFHHSHQNAAAAIKSNNMIVLQHYCPCKLFFDQSRTSLSEDLLCKHLIAVRIAFVMKRYRHIILRESEFLEQICVDC